MKIILKCKCGRTVRPHVQPPPKKHEVLYYGYVNQVLSGAGLEGLPEFGKKYRRLVRVTAKRRNWFIPFARGTKHDLVPPPNTDPCTLCDSAQYNRLCGKQDDCLPYAYWAATAVMSFTENGIQSLKDKFNVALGRDKEKKCGVTRAKSSSPTSATKPSASTAATRSVSRQTTSSGKARRKSSVKSGRRKSGWQKRSKTRSK